MKEKKSMKLADLKINSFITSAEKIQGGTDTTGSLPTGHICDTFLNSRVGTQCC